MTDAPVDDPIASPQRQAPPLAAPGERVRARLQHLFRHALQAGLVNPLLHIVTRYRLQEGK